MGVAIAICELRIHELKSLVAPSSRCSARYTRPIPPAPIRESSRYPPMTKPRRGSRCSIGLVWIRGCAPFHPLHGDVQPGKFEALTCGSREKRCSEHVTNERGETSENGLKRM